MSNIINISKEELNKYLESIGGLEYGFQEGYWGKNFLRKWMFNATRWVLYKIPYEKRPRNPFRQKIYTTDYFETAPGWNGLIKTLIQDAVGAGWNKEVCQVKEKFGGLRFYINGASREVHDIIHKYEKLSFEICEQCGEPGEVRGGGWIQTLCEKHYKND